MSATQRMKPLVKIRAPSDRDEQSFLAASRRSRELHRPWVKAPSTPGAFRAFVERSRRETHESFLVCMTADESLAGVVNVSEIVRGNFQSAYLGYYAFVPHAARGCMSEGLRLVLARAFGALKLHRVEANIQPGNIASIALVRGLGFRREGLSLRYLKIAGRWRDHERWALLADDWRRSWRTLESRGSIPRSGFPRLSSHGG